MIVTINDQRSHEIAREGPPAVIRGRRENRQITGESAILHYLRSRDRLPPRTQPASLAPHGLIRCPIAFAATSREHPTRRSPLAWSSTGYSGRGRRVTCQRAQSVAERVPERQKARLGFGNSSSVREKAAASALLTLPVTTGR